MPKPVVVPYSVILLASLLVLPPVALLAVLAVMGQIPILGALAGSAAALAAGVAALRLYRRDMANVADYIRCVAEANDPVPVPKISSAPARALNAAVARLHRE